MHLILFLAPEHKLRTPEDIDSLMAAEFPNEQEQPELYELVKKNSWFTIHVVPRILSHLPWMGTSAPKAFQNHFKIKQLSVMTLMLTFRDKMMGSNI